MLRTGTPLLPLCLLLLAGLLLGCGNRRPLTPVLNRAEALMEDHPDSAYALLRTIDSTSLAPGEEQARYALLYTQARDKNYIVQTDDSLIQVAVRYYDSIGRTDRQALAYYLWGGVYRDLNRQADALEQYLHAIPLAEKSHTYSLQGRIYLNVGYLYYLQKIYEKAILYQQKEEGIGRQISDTTLILDAMIMRGKTFIAQRNYSEAERELLEAETLSKSFSNVVLRTNIASALYKLYDRLGEKVKSLHYAKLNLAMQSDTVHCYQTFLELGDAYYQNGLYDSAVHYMRKTLQNPHTVYSMKAGAYMRLADIAKAQGNLSLAIELEQLYSLYMDSLHKASQAVAMVETEKIADLNEQRAHHRSQIRAGESILLAFALVTFICIAYLYKHYQKRIHIYIAHLAGQQDKHKKQIAMLTHQYDSKMRQEMSEKEELQNVIRQQEEKIRQANLQQQSITDLTNRHIDLIKTNIELTELNKKINQILAEAKQRGFSKQEVTNQEWERLLYEIDPNHSLYQCSLKYGFTKDEMYICILILLDYSVTDIGHLLRFTRMTIYRKRNNILEKMAVDANGSDLKDVLYRLVLSSKSNDVTCNN